MLKKTFTAIILVVLVMAVLQIVQAQTANETPLAAKARLKVQEIGTGEKARVEVKLKNGTKLKGYVSQISNGAFTVMQQKTGATQTLNYEDVEQVKKPGGISKLTWGIIAGAATAAVIVGVTVIYPVLCDGGAGC